MRAAPAGEISEITGAYNWDGRVGGSDADFESLKREKTGYFSAMESGSVRTLLL